MSNDVQIFVPGRLCLAGEHSDWAASYRLQCEDICTGAALVVTLQQGLSATATALPESLILDSSFAGRVTFTFDALYDHAKSTSLWRYAAGVAHVIYTRHDIRGGLFLRITDASLEAAKGLSSSAALCVLVASAYNRVYDLGLTIDGEMDLAYAGERLTGSLCGRMDQIVAIGPARMARMLFDGEHASHIVMRKPKKPIYVVVADLNASKDTAQILSGLQRAYPNGSESSHKRLRLVLGRENVDLIGRMQAACDEGDSERLGALMDQAQRNFDEAAIPFCPEQLESPVLHATLSSPDIQDLVYGGKGGKFRISPPHFDVAPF